MLAQWKAMKLVPYGLGMGNRWVCTKCPGKECWITLPLSEEPKENDCHKKEDEK